MDMLQAQFRQNLVEVFSEINWMNFVWARYFVDSGKDEGQELLENFVEVV